MSKKLFDLQNKNVLLTGASKGMGLAMAKGLVNHGANVVISSRKLDQCEEAAKSINKSIGKHGGDVICSTILKRIEPSL